MQQLTMSAASLLSLQKFKLYETRSRFYLIASDRHKKLFRVLKFDRTEPSDLIITEDLSVYPAHEVENLLQRLHSGNRATGGLTFVAKAYGIVGCVKFLESYYLILVTKRRKIGCMLGHEIYGVGESLMIQIPHASVQTSASRSETELRYKKILSGFDLRKDFFFSYTYPIMQSLQKNVSGDQCEVGRVQYENMFVWNAFLSWSVRSRCRNSMWTIPLVHGYFDQIRLGVLGRELCVSLISRRSRYFAGTRYLKRGVNDLGRVANDVETEQIVSDEEGRMSSVVQMRGSIPLFWSQETSKLCPKPDIMLHRYDPTYKATRIHFEDLARRYGNPIVVLTLLKTIEKRPREMILRRQFFNAVRYLNLNEENRIHYIHVDFQKFLKSKSLLRVLGYVASEALDITGFYYSGKPAMHNSSLGDMRDLKDGHFQSGVLRTNCIDCLDRTNVAQYAYGLEALGRQLRAMGFTNDPKVDPDSSIVKAIKDMYRRMGDAIAYQYGGSAAHNTVFPERQGEWKCVTQVGELLKSVQRHYNNAFTDRGKQDAINLFLGNFQRQEGKPALWELDSDYHLHVSRIEEDDELVQENDLTDEILNIAAGSSLRLPPIPVYKDDFSRMELSFDKQIKTTCNVRLYSEPDHRTRTSRIALNAMEKEWENLNSEPRSAQQESAKGECEVEKSTDIFLTGEVYMWYGGTLLAGDQDENTEKIYGHNAEICHLKPLPFDTEKEIGADLGTRMSIL